MDAAKLVDDEIVLGMIRERLAEADTRNGFILDGFPRNLAQAEALDALLGELGKPLDVVVQLHVDYEELTRRIAGRRTCSDCGCVINLFTSPPEAQVSICPKTSAPHQFCQRPDDKEETVKERLRVYDEQTRPLIAFYEQQGRLREINGEGELDEVSERLEQALAGTASEPPEVAKSTAKKTPAKAPKKAARESGAKAAASGVANRAPAKAAAKGGAGRAPAKAAAKGAAGKAPPSKAAAKKAPAKAAAKKAPAGKGAPRNAAKKTAAKPAAKKGGAAKKGASKKTAGKKTAKKAPARKR